MKTLTLDINKIENLILFRKYEEAAEKIFDLIQEQSDKELIYKSLSLLNLICDKSPSISLKVVKNISIFINELDSWLRLVTLEILYQISMYRPNLLIDLITKIRARLYDNDPTVRRLSVKIMGNLILSLHIDENHLHEIIEEYTEKLMDNDWKVKLQVIKTIKKILNQDYTKIRDLEPLLSMVIVNLRDQDDDVARASAELLKILGTFFLSKDKIFYILLYLLYNEKPRVKELIVWLFGEIGKEKSSEIIPIIPKIINLLEESNYRIQSKVINALVKIAENNFDQIWANLIHTILNIKKLELRENLINALYHLSKTYISKIFPYLFEELENPSENIREAIALVFKRLFEEYKVEIENELTRILYNLESKYWRERKKTIALLQKVFFILKNKTIAVWITIELEKALANEKDPDINEEIVYALNKIKANYEDISIIIEEINEKLSLFRNKILKFQKIPAKFREKLNAYIKEFKFNSTEIQLNKMYNDILKKINIFHKKINNFKYKRLAFDLLEDWEETKIQIIDELSIIKSFITEICEEKKSEYLLNLKDEIKFLLSKIDILKAKYDYIKDYNFNIDLDSNISVILFDSDDDLEDKFNYITELRRNLFKLDVDIRELLINNVEFNEIFKELVEKWVLTKIEIQIYLNDLDRAIKLMKEKIISHYFVDKNLLDLPNNNIKINGLHDQFAFQLLQSHIQNLIFQGIEGFKKFNNNLFNLNSKLEFLMKKNEFSHAKTLIETNTTQIHSFIEETEKQIDTIIGKEKAFQQDDNVFNKYVRPYIDAMNASKELLINKLKSFIRKSEEKLYLTQFKYYLKVMNPITFSLLSSYVKLDIEDLKDLVLKFIKEGKLNAKTVNDSIYLESIKDEIPSYKEPLIFKSYKTIGNKIHLSFKLSNPSNVDFKDLQISLKSPAYLKLVNKESSPKFIQLDDLKIGNSYEFHYVLKIDKIAVMSRLDHSTDVIKIDLYYKDPFEINRKTTKKISLLLP